MTIYIYIRSIDEYSYAVWETVTEGKNEVDQTVETKMTQKQVKSFKVDWSRLWKLQTKADNPPI